MAKSKEMKFSQDLMAEYASLAIENKGLHLAHL